MRVVFMGTPEFAAPALEGLIHYGYEIVAVYTQPDRPSGRGRIPSFSAVKAAALAHELPVFQPAFLRDETERIADLQPEAIVLAAFAQLLPAAILGIPPLGCLNIHPSLLPKHRGSSPIVAAILSGDEITGVSIMLMGKGLDAGPILDQEAVPILSEDTAGSLTLKLAHHGARLLLQILPRWVEGRLVTQSQNEAEATYSKRIVKEDGEIDWHLSATDLWRRVRAFQPWPGCYTRWQGKLLKLIEVLPLAEETGVEVGRVVQLEGPQGTHVGVQTGAGLLQLLKVQLEGRRTLTIGEFLRGQKDFLGASLLK